MHIRKFDKDFSRRFFLEQMSKGVISAGVLSPLWSTIARGQTLDKRLSRRDLVTGGPDRWQGQHRRRDSCAANVEHAQGPDIDPVSYMQITQMGREIDTHATTTDPTWLMPEDYLNASVTNTGRAVFDATGNVRTDDGSAWIGGNPFPAATTANEAFANITLSWGRYDQTFYAIREEDLNPDGTVAYKYDFVWCEMNATGRVSLPDNPFRGKEDTLRFQSVFFNTPQDVRGTAFLSIWPYDQTQFPGVARLPAGVQARAPLSHQPAFRTAAAGTHLVHF